VRKIVAIALVVLVFMAFPPATAAHGDVRLVNEVITLEPG
jgi:hypothetical protein